MPTPSQCSDIIIVPPPEDNGGEKVDFPLQGAPLPTLMRLAENLEHCELAASHTNFNSADYKRLVSYSQSADKTRGRGTDIGAQKTQQYFAFELAVE